MELWEPEIKPLRPGLAALPKWRREAVAEWPELPEGEDVSAVILATTLARDKGSHFWIMPAALDFDPDRAILDEMARLAREFGSLGKLTFNQ